MRPISGGQRFEPGLYFSRLRPLIRFACESRSMTDDSQNLALAFWRRSKEFLEAANLVAEAAGERVSIPAYYLWAHSIELSLKVFLISQGVSLRELKSRQLGHNLMALWQRGVSLGLEKKTYLYPKEIGTI